MPASELAHFVFEAVEGEPAKDLLYVDIDLLDAPTGIGYRMHFLKERHEEKLLLRKATLFGGWEKLNRATGEGIRRYVKCHTCTEANLHRLLKASGRPRKARETS